MRSTNKHPNVGDTLLAAMQVSLITGGGKMTGQERFEIDWLSTSAGELAITFLGHGSLFFTFNGKVIHVDPFSRVADYTALPKADLILITHEHGDHLDLAALTHVQTGHSVVILTPTCAAQLGAGLVMANGDERDVDDIHIQAVPAYNLIHKREDGQPFHPKGLGNGYVITFSDCRVYVAGDTEAIPEMKNLREISCAFLPMNLPYTMTPEMVAEAARSFRPSILYPYHYGETDPTRLVDLLKADPDIEVRIRKMA
jgi:L-ascorbate metabolism protein UlaG (beta-lactamase superfamily)